MIPKHPQDRRDKLRKAGLSEGSELDPAHIEALDAAPLDSTAAKLRQAAQGDIAPKPMPTKEKLPHRKPQTKRHSTVTLDTRPRKPTMLSEAIRILAERGPMHYRDLTAAILKEGKVKSKGNTPAQTLSAALGRSADAERVAPGVYKAAG